MCRIACPEYIQKENDKLVEMYSKSDIVDIDEYIEKNASQEFKDYIKSLKEEGLI